MCIRDRGHEEHRAEQAHITHRAHLKRLKHRKGLDAFDMGAMGNMSLFGAVFFMPLVYWAFAKLSGRSAADVFDVFTVCLVFTLMCARLNCIFSGCCLGAHIPIEGPTHLRFPTREMELLFYVILLSRCLLYTSRCV